MVCKRLQPKRRGKGLTLARGQSHQPTHNLEQGPMEGLEIDIRLPHHALLPLLPPPITVFTFLSARNRNKGDGAGCHFSSSFTAFFNPLPRLSSYPVCGLITKVTAEEVTTAREAWFVSSRSNLQEKKKFLFALEAESSPRHPIPFLVDPLQYRQNGEVCLSHSMPIVIVCGAIRHRLLDELAFSLPYSARS